MHLYLAPFTLKPPDIKSHWLQMLLEVTEVVVNQQ